MHYPLFTTAGLSGLAFEEGEYGVCGYVVSSPEILLKLSEGDVIEKASIVYGADRLVVPK
jgi:hypothetical protein